MTHFATLALALCLSAPLLCAAADTPDIPAPPHIANQLPAARLAGEGNYRWFGLKIYRAQLWVGPRGYDVSEPGATGFALDLHYAHAFEGRKIAQKSIDEIEQLGFGSVEQRKRWQTQMAACFPNVEDGTHLTGIFMPGTGVRYYRDGKAICDIQDKDFAFAFFAIWLDPHTSAQGLRAALLNKAGPSSATAAP